MNNTKVTMRAYTDAKFNMSVDNIRTAIVIQERRVEASQKEVLYHTAVLEGYRKALVEKTVTA